MRAIGAPSRWGFSAAVAALLLHGGATAQSTPAADILLVGGKILTVDTQDSVAEAVAITGNRISAVGTRAQVEAMAGPETRIIDLQGRTVTPGLIDTHIHLASGGTQDALFINLSPERARDMDGVRKLIAEKVVSTPPGAFVRGNGWDETKLAEKRFILASDIDAASPNHPVYLTNTTGHYGVANSVALQMAGITSETPDPPGGTIHRLPDGSPSGLLLERAQNLVRAHIPALTDDELYTGITSAAQGLVSECMTGAKDPGIGEQVWSVYQRALTDGKLPVRLFALWRTPDTMEEAQALVSRIGRMTRPYETTGNDRLISGGIKITLDGSGGGRTAWMHEDWHKHWDETDTGNKGYPVMPLDRAMDLIKLYHSSGLHVGIHAIGDRAIDWTVDALEEVEKADPDSDLRHSIIHANVPTDYALDKMAMLQKNYGAAYPEAQGLFLWWLGDTYAGNLGPDRASRLKPFAAYAQRGIIWMNGSDYPVSPYPARNGLWASVDRSTLLGLYGDRPFGTANAADIHMALRSYTAWAARSLYLENKVGSIEVGKYADIAVWDQDIYTAPIDKVKDMKCAITIFDGKIVHGG